MIAIEGVSIGIQAKCVKVYVPQNPMGKLMYYLQTVNALIDFNVPYSLQNYKEYQSLSFDEENQVLALAVLLSPDIFIENGIMINEPRLCQNFPMQIYEISAMHSAIAITEEFVIGGKKVHTLMIMAYKNSWLERNYFNPIKVYSDRINAIADGTVERFRPKSVESKTTRPPPYVTRQGAVVFPLGDGYRIIDNGPPKPKKSKCCLLI